MKKKFILFAIIVVAAIAGFNVYQGQGTQPLSDVILANVDALANDDEINPDCPNGCVEADGEACWCYYFHKDYQDVDWAR